jgi:hypothetical protein
MRGNATILVLVTLAVLTTTSLQLWRLWAMQGTVLQQREQWYQSWWAMNAAYDACWGALRNEFEGYAAVAKQSGSVAIRLPALMQRVGGLTATLLWRNDVLVVVITLDTGVAQTVRFLVEKQQGEDGQLYLVAHHVTFGACI